MSQYNSVGLDYSTSVDQILSRLTHVRPSARAGEWTACCPAHDDRRPSLSIRQATDGTILLHCHAGCTAEEIVAALGLTLADLFPGKPERRNSQPRRHRETASQQQVYPTATGVISALERSHGQHTAAWSYHDASGEVAGMVVRWDKQDREGKPYKLILPVARVEGGWANRAMAEPRPLYRLPQLLQVPRGKPVFVVEGEKACDAAVECGLIATTSAGGANAAAKTDWSPLQGRRVIILPDNDDAGKRYAADVIRLCQAAGAAEVRILDLAAHAPELPAGGDIADILASSNWCGLPLGDEAKPSDLGELLLRLAEKKSEAAQPLSPPLSPSSSHNHANNGQASTPEPVLVRLADVQPEAIRWLWPGRIPAGRITLLAGRPGVGKSWAALDIAARVSTGSPWPDELAGHAPRGDVLLLAAEDDTGDTIRPRLDAMLANADRVHVLQGARVNGTVCGITLRDLDVLAAALNKLPACKLIVVDPVGSFLGGRLDAHRDGEVRSLLQPLADLARRHGAAVLVVAHTRKGGAWIADEAVLGSVAFVGLARSVLHVVFDPDDATKRRRFLLPGKSNLAEPPAGLAFRIGGVPARVQWEIGVINADADAVMAAIHERMRPRRGPEPTARNAAVEWLAELLQDGPMPVAEIRKQAEAADLGWRTIRRAQEVLGIVPRKQAFGGGWEWTLPEDGQVSSRR